MANRFVVIRQCAQGGFGNLRRLLGMAFEVGRMMLIVGLGKCFPAVMINQCQPLNQRLSECLIQSMIGVVKYIVKMPGGFLL